MKVVFLTWKCVRRKNDSWTGIDENYRLTFVP